MSGGSRTSRPGGTGEAIVTPTARVEFEGYTVTLDAGYGGLLDDAALLRVAEKVLPAVPGWPPAG
ncbi:hypothetical protein ACFW7J_24325 [Streptomyces sp. NPDC059525]|uniref:hypothetical protein n=1 Tax=Streptomyces sp. NPDC059525 TaxID=3346857 RepID=UPI0036B58243